MNSGKGCANEACVSYKRKVKYKSVDKFCPQCGAALRPVCKSRGCYTFLDDTEQKRCARCVAKREDNAYKAKKFAGGIAGGVTIVAGVLVTKGEELSRQISAVLRK